MGEHSAASKLHAVNAHGNGVKKFMRVESFSKSSERVKTRFAEREVFLTKTRPFYSAFGWFSGRELVLSKSDWLLRTV